MFDPDDVSEAVVSEGGEDSDAEPEVVAPAAPWEALFQVTRIVLSRTQFAICYFNDYIYLSFSRKLLGLRLVPLR